MNKIVHYVLTLLIVIMGVYYIWFNHSMLFKLIPMALIIFYALTNLFEQTERKSYHIITIVGLLFCISGDYLLQWFVIGLFTFLCGHIFYIISFRKQIKAYSPDAFRIIIIIYAIIMMAIMTVALINKQEYVLIAPVIIYTTIIALMAFTAWKTKNRWLIIGSILFLVSDSILALNKFVIDVPFSSALIMVTYYGANYFIATSLKSKT